MVTSSSTPPPDIFPAFTTRNRCAETSSLAASRAPRFIGSPVRDCSRPSASNAACSSTRAPCGAGRTAAGRAFRSERPPAIPGLDFVVEYIESLDYAVTVRHCYYATLMRGFVESSRSGYVKVQQAVQNGAAGTASHRTVRVSEAPRTPRGRASSLYRA